MRVTVGVPAVHGRSRGAPGPDAGDMLFTLFVVCSNPDDALALTMTGAARWRDRDRPAVGGGRREAPANADAEIDERAACMTVRSAQVPRSQNRSHI